MTKRIEMSEKARKRKTARENLALIKEFNKKILSLSFERITEETLRKIALRFNFEEPDSVRIQETKDQFMFEKWFENYRIVVITSFNPNLGKEGEFTSKGGTGWVLVTENITERVYVRKFYRVRTHMANFVNNLFNEAALLVNRLEHRPIVKGTSLLYNIKQTDVETVWVHPSDETKTKYFFLELDGDLKKHFDKLDYNTKNYQNVVRTKKGTVNRSRDKRKTWNKEVDKAVLS